MLQWTLRTASVFVHWSIRVALSGLEPYSHVRQMGYPLVPSGGLLLPPPHPGEVQPSQLSHQAPEVTLVPAWERWQEHMVGRGHPVPHFEFVPPMSIQDTSLQLLWLVDIHWSNCKAREMPPLQGFHLLLALVMGQERAGFNSWGPCARRSWLECLLLVRVKLIHIKEDQQKMVVFLKRNPTGMKWAEVQAVGWKQFIFQA